MKLTGLREELSAWKLEVAAFTIWTFAKTTGSALSVWSCFLMILKKVGDVRQLAGRVVEFRGELKEYDGRAEIVLDGKQLDGETVRIAPLSKSFDVEQRGHFSAGQS